jgi:hypothetical protein
MNHDEVALQFPLKRVSQIHCRHSRAAVEKEQNGVVTIVVSYEYPLVSTPRPQLFERCDAALAADRRPFCHESQ